MARDSDINWSNGLRRNVADSDRAGTDYADVTDVRIRYGSIWVDIPAFVDPGRQAARG